MSKKYEDEYYDEYEELDEDDYEDYEEEYEELDDYEDYDTYSYKEPRKIRLFSLRNIIIAIFIAILILLTITLIDINRIKHDKMPILTIKTVAYKDGGTKEYYGLGYKLIKYHQIQGRRDTEFGSWKLKYNTDAITVKDVDLAIEMTGNELKTFAKYNKKFVRIVSTLKKVDTDNNRITMGFTDEDGKYSLDIVCQIVTDQSVEDLVVGEETTIIGTVDSFKRSDSTKANRLYVKNCFAEQ